MRLTRFKFGQDEGGPREWTLDDLTLGPINLLVGKNASGKSRTLNVINLLARLISGGTKISFSSGHYDVSFVDGRDEYHYELNIIERNVVKEVFIVNADVRMERGHGGSGTIYATKEARDIEFQTPVEEIAAFARRDSIQHPFFDKLHEWGDSLRYFPFGTPLGRESLGVLVKEKIPHNDKDPNNVIGIYKKGESLFSELYKNNIIYDMRSLDYPIDDIGVMPPQAITVSGLLASDILSLYVKEKDLSSATEQFEMSQGMFRALSLIVQLNYSRLAKTASTIVIDDIGEGLDFERSCALINLLMRKSGENVQLIMATNDRFVMNNMPLDTWTVLRREGQRCLVKNARNSKEIFEMFKITGMNNFDFFATGFVDENASDFLEKVESE